MTDEVVNEQLDDNEFIAKIENLLENYKKEINLSVHQQLASVKATPATPEKAPVMSDAVSLLKEELTAVKAQLSKERLTQQVSSFASKYHLHPDLLQLIVESNGINETDGVLTVGKDNPQALENFVKDYAATPAGARIKTDRPQGTNLKDSTAASPTDSVADALFNFAIKGG
jgi:hypothetical protein